MQSRLKRPSLLTQIDIDRQNERARVKAEHQTDEYKEVLIVWMSCPEYICFSVFFDSLIFIAFLNYKEKYLTMFYGNKKGLISKTRLFPPDKFWAQWKEKVRTAMATLSRHGKSFSHS